MMTAHLNTPAIEDNGLPASLSKKIVTGYLKNEIGYRGFVITDAINMKGAAAGNENITVQALIAGNDMVEFVPDLDEAIRSVKKAIDAGKLSLTEIDEKCITILALKRWAGLNQYKPAETKNLTENINTPASDVINRKLIKNALTVLVNQDVLPIQGLDTLKIASVVIGGTRISPFQTMLEKYTDVDHFVLSKNAKESDWMEISRKLKGYSLVISAIVGLNLFPTDHFGITEIQTRAVKDLSEKYKSIFVVFGNAYSIKNFESIQHSAALVAAYQNTPLTQELAAQLLFGGFDASGKLPVTIDNRFKRNDGLTFSANQTFAYTIPEESGINSKLLDHYIDSLANLGLKNRAFPGCQVLVAKNGNVIFHKTYGFHTYENREKVEKTDIYDWASITKVTGPLPAIMRLVDEGKLDTDQPLSNYWPAFKGSNKENIRISEFLTHQSGIPAWIPYWMMAADKKGNLNPAFFRNAPSDSFQTRVSSKLYLKNGFRQSIFDTIRNSKLGPKKYVYSCLSFYIYPEIISGLTQTDYQNYIKNSFYRPLGATTVTYNPYLQFPLDRIIPTENDTIFRKEKLRGFVHDEGAAMMGGVSGNAGLFGTTGDLAKIFLMYLQKGYFGGKRYISEETVNRFIKVQFPENDNRRGLGFDKPLLDNDSRKPQDAYPAMSCSKNSFGHSGFTGTFVWADPDNGLLFVFFSNRVNPTRANENLFNLNIRSSMLQKTYDCIKTGLN